MQITEIPFAKHIGVVQYDDDTLSLIQDSHIENHIQSIHASAQFTLAETQSGLCLQRTFPELESKVYAVLRSSEVKYKNPAYGTLLAKSNISQKNQDKCLAQLNRKGRASISIDVELIDKEGQATMMGSFVWFVQLV